MPRFAANLSMMFNEVPFLERFARARAAGFEAVEFLFPYDFPANEVAGALKEQGLSQALFNMPPGDWERGERGVAALPGREDEFRASVDKALEYAEALDCPRLHCMAGIIPDGIDPAQAEVVFMKNLAHAASELAAHDRTVLIEPLNHRDAPGYLLTRQDHARGIIERSHVTNLRLQFDIYHCQIVHGDLIRWMEQLMPVIDHVQIADVPERHEPGTGEINYTNVLAALDRLGYTGWVGCEYRPANGTEAGLGWMDTVGG